jgi:hypothetical protein
MAGHRDVAEGFSHIVSNPPDAQAKEMFDRNFCTGQNVLKQIRREVRLQ